jgi:hypothetical protein
MKKVEMEVGMEGPSAFHGQKLPTERALEHRFEADEWSLLTVEQRVRRCHLMAEEAQKHAKSAPAEIAGTYLQIANDWLQLAAEMQDADSGQPVSIAKNA